MKLLVFSDTHNHPDSMLDTIKNTPKLDSCIFLGDGSYDADMIESQFPSLPLYRVQGNCDVGCHAPIQGLASFGGVLFFYTHGHRYGVKSSLENLYQTAKNSGANVALFGHTHIPLHTEIAGFHLFNPGSLSYPRAHAPSYGIIEIHNSTPTFHHKFL